MKLFSILLMAFWSLSVTASEFQFADAVNPDVNFENFEIVADIEHVPSHRIARLTEIGLKYDVVDLDNDRSERKDALAFELDDYEVVKEALCKHFLGKDAVLIGQIYQSCHTVVTNTYTLSRPNLFINSALEVGGFYSMGNTVRCVRELSCSY